MIRHALTDKLSEMTPEELLDNDLLDEVMELLIHEYKIIHRRLHEIEALETIIEMRQGEVDELKEKNTNDAEHMIRLMQHASVKALDIMDIRCYIKNLKEGPRLYIKEIGEKYGKKV